MERINRSEMRLVFGNKTSKTLQQESRIIKTLIAKMLVGRKMSLFRLDEQNYGISCALLSL